jgi:hypothetical protein
VFFEEQQDHQEGQELKELFYQANREKAIEKIIERIPGDLKNILFGHFQLDGFYNEGRENAHGEYKKKNAFFLVLENVDAPEVFDPNESEEETKYYTG